MLLSHDDLIEKRVSPLIESQFPGFYREAGPLFVLFMRTYVEWMETSGGALYHARRIPDYKDIDRTVDDFIVYFKEKYLSGIQLETESNVRQLVKHSLDLYRTKGTERSIDLLFRLVFGTGAQVYYPKTDLLMASDGDWHSPLYLEVTDDGLNRFAGSQIRGGESKATAFVERVVHKRTPTKTVHLLYLSNGRGNFTPGETINRTSDPLDTSTCPAVVGSLRSVDVITGGSGHVIGEEVKLTSPDGTGGVGRVSATTNALGVVTLSLADGGYGYTSNSQLIISDLVMILDVSANNTTAGEYLDFNEVVSQANSGYTGRVVGMVDRVDLTYVSPTPFIVGETITQGTGSAVVRTVNQVANNGTLSLTSVRGRILPNRQIRGQTSNAVANTTSVAIRVGMITTNSTPDSEPAHVVTAASSGLKGTVTTFAAGSGFSAQLSPALLYPETISIAADLIGPYVNVHLNAATFGFTGNPAANISTIIGQSLVFNSVTIGRLSAITVTGVGTDYNIPPVVRVYEPKTYQYHKRGYDVLISNPTAQFQVGEVVTQSSTGARGVVYSSNSTHLVMTRLSWTDVKVTTNTSSKLVGTDSATTANAVTVSAVSVVPLQPDYDSIGLDAVINTSSIIATGSISQVEVTDSGYGYAAGETVSFEDGEGVVVLGGTGAGSGFYRRDGGFPSDIKKLRDGHYWQEYSYEVRSSIPLTRYSDMLKTVLHAAGTKFFGSLIYQASGGAISNISTSISIGDVT